MVIYRAGCEFIFLACSEEYFKAIYGERLIESLTRVGLVVRWVDPSKYEGISGIGVNEANDSRPDLVFMAADGRTEEEMSISAGIFSSYFVGPRRR